MKKIFKILETSKILMPVFVISMFLGMFLFFYIPKTMQSGIIKNIVEHSKNAVERLQLQREYYVNVVVGDVKKYAPNISFDYEHKGVDGKLPFPTTTVHDLSEMYSKRSDVKFFLYSKYPFLNRKDRVLSPFQKKAIEEVEKSDDGIYYQKDIIEGKEVLRVAVADYMVVDGCVNCHNSHKLKDWDFDWKLGDKRGVLEIITPMDIAVGDMNRVRNNIVLSVLGLMILLVIYYASVLLRRENELFEENENLFDDFDKHVIASKTDLKGKITYVSQKFCEVAGYTNEELMGNSHNMVRHPDMLKTTFSQMWGTITKNETWIGEFKNVKRDGDFYWVNAIVSPMFDKEGVKTGYSAIRQNISNRKKIEELNLTLESKIKNEVEKNRLQDQQLLQQSRLAQMGEMLSMIAHQWRQPLSAINATSIAINIDARFEILDSKKVIMQTDKISEYSQHLSTTIEDFRDFFKSNKEKKNICFCDLIKSVLGIVEDSLINQNIKVIQEISCEETFETYANEVKQVILNLIKNAEDVLLEKNIEDPFIKIITYKKGDNYLLEVSDNGGGIPENILEHIFDPYFSTKKQKDGTGLGLYMSKTIIEEHCNGKLTVANNKDGAVFQITL